MFPRRFVQFLLALCWVFGPSVASAGVVDRLEASVNSNLILLSDLYQFRKTVNLRSQLDPLFSGSPIALKGAAATDSEIVQFLIDERVIALQFPVSDAEVEQEINSIQGSNRIDRATLRRALSAQGYRFEDYFELIRVSAAKRNLIDREIRSKVVITDDDVRAHSRGGGKSTGLVKRMSYRISLISFPLSDYESAEEARKIADQAQKTIAAGTSFEEIRARVHGQDSQAVLGPLQESEISPLIRTQLKKLKPDQVSGVFGGPDARGFYILKLVDATESSASGGPVDESVRSQLATAEYSRQIQLWLDRQRSTMFVRVAGQK